MGLKLQNDLHFDYILVYCIKYWIVMEVYILGSTFIIQKYRCSVCYMSDVAICERDRIQHGNRI